MALCVKYEVQDLLVKVPALQCPQKPLGITHTAGLMRCGQSDLTNVGRHFARHGECVTGCYPI